MMNRAIVYRESRLIGALRLLMAATLLFAWPVSAQPQEPSFAGLFIEVAPQGFGDRHNNMAWSMQWWKGKLYVGTLRSWICWESAASAAAFPLLSDFFYPPGHPDADCTEDPIDLPLQAEIWRFTPWTKTWQRVYRSPQDVAVPGSPGRYVAKDIGYRGMLVFPERDGTEGLYVFGVSPRTIFPDNVKLELPPPRILRSTDGLHFEPVPQDQGTFLGDIEKASFRAGTIYNGRMYFTAGGAHGSGELIESQEPSIGNDSFRVVTPPGVGSGSVYGGVWDGIPFNGFYYVGLEAGRHKGGFSVVKTDAVGEPPYSFSTVIEQGGYREEEPSRTIVSLHEFDGRLYIGTDKPAELYRINPDDTWELVVGMPRETPDGWKYPLSGMGDGFDWHMNNHIYRMQEHKGLLYIGTHDNSRYVTETIGIPALDKLLRPHYGFGFYKTADGQYFVPITTTGFGDEFQTSIRTFASTRYGLFVGTGSYWYGLRVLLGIGLGGMSLTPPAPERLEVESLEGRVVLSWKGSHEMACFRIFRSEPTSSRKLQCPALDPDTWVPGPFRRIGKTDQLFYVDDTIRPDRPYHYYVISENLEAVPSKPSNLVRAPSLSPPVSFDGVEGMVADWIVRDETVSQDQPDDLLLVLSEALKDVEAGDLDGTLDKLTELRRMAMENPATKLLLWRAHDFDILLARLARRVLLVKEGILLRSCLN